MGLIKGIPIKLIKKVVTSHDPFGKAVYSEQEVVVENVLIAPATSTDPTVVNQYNLTGRKAVYTLSIPKGDTHVWENQEVEFFGERWKVIGIPLEGIESMIPLDWNKRVMVERYG